jgi:hypothetical protein
MYYFHVHIDNYSETPSKTRITYEYTVQFKTLSYDVEAGDRHRT